MTVTMSDRDYAALKQAAVWVQLHAGVDAPEYSALDQLTAVLDAIGHRRPTDYEGESPQERQQRRSDRVSALFELHDQRADGADKLA